MTFFRNFILSLLFLAILMAASPPFVHSSRPYLELETRMAESRATEGLLDTLGNGNSFGTDDSAREVPTGPDPLHHNNSPKGH